MTSFTEHSVPLHYVRTTWAAPKLASLSTRKLTLVSLSYLTLYLNFSFFPILHFISLLESFHNFLMFLIAKICMRQQDLSELHLTDLALFRVVAAELRIGEIIIKLIPLWKYYRNIVNWLISQIKNMCTEKPFFEKWVGLCQKQAKILLEFIYVLNLSTDPLIGNI